MTSTAEKEIQDGVLTTGNFTIQAQMPNGKTMTVSGYIYSHNTKEDISKQIDIYHDVVDRQRLKAEIPELEAKLEQRIRAMHDVKDSLDALVREKEVNKKLPSAKVNMIDQLATNVRKLNEDIEKGRQAITDAKAEILKV